MAEHKKKTKVVEPINDEADAPAEIAEESAADDLASLEKDLAEAQDQCKEFSEGWQRERADFLNYKKRVERDQAQLHQVISGNIIKKFLNVMDDMESCLLYTSRCV